jgi:predicted dehydrogenase
MNRRIGVAVVGTGWMGATILRRFHEREDVELVAVHDTNREHALRIMGNLKLPQNAYLDDYASILRDARVEAVAICSPNHLHGQQSIAALKAGKHVFCEKPCATDYAEFNEQLRLERGNPELISFVDYILYFDTMEKRIVDMARDGTFGAISQLQVNYRHPVNIEGAKAWKLSAGSVGDAIGMGIIHSLFVMVNIMKTQNARPAQIMAVSSPIQKRPFEIPAVWDIQITFDNGATGICQGNIDHSNGYDAYHNIHGTEGGLIFDSLLDRPQKIRFWSSNATEGAWVYPLDPDRCRRDGVEEHLWPADTTTPDSGDVMDHQTDACVGHFISCIQKKQPSPLSFNNSAGVSELAWAAQMSAALHRPVPLPLNQESAAKFFSPDEVSDVSL